MRLGRPIVAVILTEDERVQLESWAHRSRTAPQLARRARLVLACAAGRDNKTVAKRLRLSPATVGKWRARFVRDRVDGLLDEPRPGAPRTVTDAQVERVVMETLEMTPRGATHWSTRSLAGRDRDDTADGRPEGGGRRRAADLRRARSECRILHDSALLTTWDPDKRRELDANYRRDLARFATDRDRRVAAARKGAE